MLGTLAVGYLFLGGAGAGAIVVASVLDLALVRAPFGTDARVSVDEAPPCERVAAFALLAGFAALALGVLCLLFDLGRIDRVLDLFLRPSPTYLTVGSFALAVLAACGAFLTLVRFAYLPSVPRAAAVAVEAVAVAVGLVVMVYTGLLLQGLGAVALWRSPFVPVLFTLSSLSCGSALVLAAAQLTGAASAFATVLGRLAVVDAVVIVLEAAALAVFAGTALAGVGGDFVVGRTAEALAASAEALVAGEAAWLFWGGLVLAGLAVPFALDVILARLRRPRPAIALVAAACVLAGGLAMRYCVVEAGMHPLLAMAS